MHTREAIGRRLKKLRHEHKFSQKHIAKILFISQAAYSLIENSQNGIAVEHIVKLSNLYKVTTDYILTGNKTTMTVSREHGFTPLLTTSAHAGFLDNLKDDFFYDVKDWYRIPGFDPSIDQMLFEVEGDSMVPTVLEGDILICQDQQNIDRVLDGSAVVIITNKSILVKRYRKSDKADYVHLENDHTTPGEINSEEIEKSSILKIMMVRGKLTSVLVPFHQMASKGKIEVLEENIEMLKKELFQMNKKLNALSSKN